VQTNSLVQTLRKGMEPVSRWCAIAGGISLLVMMAVVVSDVILRATLRTTFQASIELVEVLLVIVVFSGMAYCAVKKAHIRVDVLIDRFSSTARLAITACTDLMSVVVIFIISWRSAVMASVQYTQHFDTGLLGIPKWPFAAATCLFMGIFALTMLVNFIESLGDLAAGGRKKLVWLTPCIIVSLILFIMTFWPSIYPIKIEPTIFGLLSLVLLFTLIFLRLHIGVSMAFVALWGMGYLTTTNTGLSLLGRVSNTVASSYIWSVAPLFILMGFIVANANFSRDLYHTAYKWIGHTPGGLASATIAACGAFAAVVGDSLTGTLTMGSIALPEMKAYKYDSKLAAGAVAAGGSIGILIPPSIGFIVYAFMVEESVGRLFIAGILPGILLTAALIVLVYFRCRINPRLGPPGPPTGFKEKVTSLRGSWPVALLFLVVIGGIWSGIFTPTEAGAIGVFTALVISLAMRRLTRSGFTDAVLTSIQLTAMLFFILIIATAITNFFAITKLPFILASSVGILPVGPYVTLAVILFLYLILGCLMNAIPILILTLPVIYPTVMALGFDPIWFGVLMVMMVEIGVITPPIGVTVFALAGISDVPMYTIFRGVFPFWLVMLIVVALVMAFPQIALFLPNLMMGG